MTPESLPEVPPFPELPAQAGDAARWIIWAQEYAAAAVIAERERCAVLCDNMGPDDFTGESCAEAIREQPKVR